MHDVSVIIPAYIPDQKYLNMLYRAIVSLKNQTVHNFEVIPVMNGCSHDVHEQSRKFMELMDMPYLMLFKPDRTGAGDAFNYGLAHANGKYITRLDADDEYMPRKIEVQFDLMEKNPEIDFSFTSCFFRTGNHITEPYYGNHEYLTNEQIHTALPYENVLVGATFMATPASIKRAGGYQRTIGREDYDTWLCAVENNCVMRKIPDQSYIYTQGTSLPRTA